MQIHPTRATFRSVALWVGLVAAIAACSGPSGAVVEKAPEPTSGLAARLVGQDDPRGEACALDAQKVMAVIELQDGRAFRQVFPEAGLAPELELVDQPVYLAVFDGHWSGPVAQNPLMEPGAPEDGTLDVCVVYGETRTIYANVSPEGMHLPES